jgi:xylulose-5-phosphate/fructose-6-phosphate phosphoketolase
MQGYTMTGCTGIFPTYESFLPIVATMMIQYSKFLKVSKEVPWRKDLNSFTYISTSTWTRQEHNGLSHQNPGFIGSVLQLKPEIGRVYLPPDTNTFLSTLAHCLRSKNYVNLIVGSKASQVTWLSADEAHAHCKAGAGVWRFASSHGGLDPDVVLVGIGADLTFEVVAAAAYLRDLVPSLAVRVVNVTDLMILSKEGAHPHALHDEDFDALFTADRPIHFNYHGYANELQGLLFGRSKLERMTVDSYREEGTTTTPFDMLIRNNCSRYHVAMAAIRGASKHDPAFAMESIRLLAHVQKDISRIQHYIYSHGVDPPGMYDPPAFAPEGPRRALTGRDLPERKYLLLPEIHFPKLPPWLSLGGSTTRSALNGAAKIEGLEATKESHHPEQIPLSHGL